jgi:hypothetical protein
MLKSEKSRRFISGVALGAIFIFFGGKGPMMRPDSWEYLRYHRWHAPLYSLILMSFNAVAGKIGLYAVALLQIGCILAASLRFCLFLRSHHGLNRCLSAAALAVLISPLWFFYGNYLLSEAFAYVFFLMCFLHLGRWLSRPQRKEYIPAGIYLALAVLTRTDMIFLCAPYAAAGLYAYRETRDRAGLRKAAAFLAVALLAADIATRTCNYAFAGNFGPTPTLGIMELGNAVYVSDAGDARLYQGGPYYDVMRRMLEEADRQKLLSKYRFELDRTIAFHHSNVNVRLLDLATAGGFDFAGRGRSRGPGESAYGDLRDVDRFCLKASWPLFRANGRHFARLVASRIWSGLSFYEGAITLLLAALPFLLIAEPMTVLLALFALSHLSHVFLIAVITAMDERFIFNSYNLMLLAPLLVLQRALSMRSGLARERPRDTACT